jgi:large subunit ribosomal protein L25
MVTMEQLLMNAKNRQRKAKGDNRRLRREGLVPAVIYGGDKEPQAVTIDHHELELILRGARRTNAIFNLTVEGEAGQEQAIIREVQRHPTTEKMVHVDFLRIDLEREIEVSVPLHVTGATPKGVRAGGILEHLARTLQIRCKPLHLPKNLEADLSELELNQSFHVRDLTLPEGIQVMDEPETPLFTILALKVEVEPTPAEEVAATEPELIGAKKAEEEKEDKEES